MPPEGEDAAPLILTLRLDAASFAFFDGLRRAHFPPERNVVPAHVTLFHALPAARSREIKAWLAQVAAREKPIPIEAREIVSIGRGVAFLLAAPRLSALRAALAAEWAPWLTPQDAGGYRPHVTVQNKVDPKTARALQAELARGFSPFPVKGEGLLLWRYLGGPWERVAEYRFAGRG